MTTNALIITLAVVTFVVIVVIPICVSIRWSNKEEIAINKLIDEDRLNRLRRTNEDEFIKEAEYILKYTRDFSWSNFSGFRCGKSKHGKGYYIVGVDRRTGYENKFFPCTGVCNHMGSYFHPDYYLKDMDEVHKYYVDLLDRELSVMRSDRARHLEYMNNSEL